MGADLGFAVLADGMGGHAAGDVASKIVVTEVFSELKLQSGDRKTFIENLPAILLEAANAANDCVKGHVINHAETAGMGATLLAPVFMGRHLWWISIGDSPLFLFRDGRLMQINEDHSMAPQIDFMIRSGMMDEDTGRNHPDRSCLTSVLGGDHIPRVDCPTEPTKLRDGDILVVASDGLQYLSELEIESILAARAGDTSTEITDELLMRLDAHGDPEQDNASFSVIKVEIEPVAPQQPVFTASRSAQNGGAYHTPEPPTHAADHSAKSANLFARGSSFFRGSTS